MSFFCIGYGSVTPVFQTQTISSVESHRVGIINSLFFNSMDAGMDIAALILGIAANTLGYRSVYVLGVVLIAAAFLYFKLTRKIYLEAMILLNMMMMKLQVRSSFPTGYKKSRSIINKPVKVKTIHFNWLL